MSRADSLSRAVGLTVIITAPLAAVAALGVAALTRPRRPSHAARLSRSISRVPARPPLWDARPETGPVLAIADPRDPAPVPPESNHARPGAC